MDFVALDLETANSNRSSICSIGLVKVENNMIIDEFYTLINPETNFDDFNISIHNITPEDVKDAPTFENIFPKILDFINDYTLAAHFTAFDMYAIKDALIESKIEIPHLKYFCTYRLSKSVFQLSSYRLNSVAEHLKIENPKHHNALNDARVCANIALEIEKIHNNSLDIIIRNHNFIFGNLHNKGFITSYRSDKDFEIINNPDLHSQEHEFYQKNICFTGSLQIYTRKEIAQLVSDIGAIFNKNLKSDTNYLVIGNLENLEKATGQTKSSKIKKAEQLSAKGKEIEILSEYEFMNLLNAKS